MSIIQNELDKEIFKPNPNVAKIRMYNILLKKGYVTKQDFLNTGRVMYPEIYKKEKKTVKLHPNCNNIVEYVGGYTIQTTNDGCFIIGDDNSSKSKCHSLGETENELWNQVKSIFNHEEGHL